MKKILLLISVAFMVISTNVFAIEKPEVTDREKITIYMFRSNTCSACETALEAFNEWEDEYDDYFEIITFETSKKDNHELYSDLIDDFELDNYIPFFIIGNDYGKTGFNENEILEEAFKAYEDDEYEDYVSEKISGEEDKYEITNLKEACEEKGIIYWENTNNITTVIIATVFVLIGIGLILLVFMPTKKNK